MAMDLDARVRRLEDRALISETVIKYAVGVDRRDWPMSAGCFTDPVHADFASRPAADYSREDLVASVSRALDGFTVRKATRPRSPRPWPVTRRDRQSLSREWSGAGGRRGWGPPAPVVRDP